MLGKSFLIILLSLALFGSVCAVAAQEVSPPFTKDSTCSAETTPDEIFEREGQIDTMIAGNSATVETDIQITARNPFLLDFSLKRLHLLDQMGLSPLSRGSRRAKGGSRGTLMWKLDSSGFADLVFIDLHGFTPDRYQLKSQRSEICQDQPCCAFVVTLVGTHHPRKAGPFFIGTVWVETSDYTIIRFKGHYIPESRLNFPLTVEAWFEFDSTRIKVGPHLWLPDRVTSRNAGKNEDQFFPEFEASTTFSNFKPL
jgi:hypothetical protein